MSVLPVGALIKTIGSLLVKPEPPAAPITVPTRKYVSDRFIRSVDDGWRQLSHATRYFLSSTGSKIALATRMDEIFTKEEDQKLTPGIDDNRTHINQCHGLYFNKYKTIALTLACDRPTHVFLHEAGHDFSFALGKPSEWPEFMQAYKEDLEELGGATGARAKGLGYFVQDYKPGAGPNEAFAEIYAELHNRMYKTGNIRLHFPRTTAWIHQMLDTFEEAYENGGIPAVYDLAYDLQHPLSTIPVNNHEEDAIYEATQTRKTLKRITDSVFLQKFDSLLKRMEQLPEDIRYEAQIMFARAVGRENLFNSEGCSARVLSFFRQSDHEVEPGLASALKKFSTDAGNKFDRFKIKQMVEWAAATEDSALANSVAKLEHLLFSVPELQKISPRSVPYRTFVVNGVTNTQICLAYNDPVTYERHVDNSLACEINKLPSFPGRAAFDSALDAFKTNLLSYQKQLFQRTALAASARRSTTPREAVYASAHL